MLLYRYILAFFCVLDDTGAKCSQGNNAICGLKESIYKMCPTAGYRALHLGKVMNYVNKSTMQHIPYIISKRWTGWNLNQQPQHIYSLSLMTSLSSIESCFNSSPPHS
jgi:hypothetical protein